MKRLVLGLMVGLVLVAAAHAARPLGPHGRPVRPTVGYVYVQPGRAGGRHVWRLCHVPVHRRRWCGRWHRRRPSGSTGPARP